MNKCISILLIICLVVLTACSPTGLTEQTTQPAMNETSTPVSNVENTTESTPDVPAVPSPLQEKITKSNGELLLEESYTIVKGETVTVPKNFKLTAKSSKDECANLTVEKGGTLVLDGTFATQRATNDARPCRIIVLAGGTFCANGNTVIGGEDDLEAVLCLTSGEASFGETPFDETMNWVYLVGDATLNQRISSDAIQYLVVAYEPTFTENGPDWSNPIVSTLSLSKDVVISSMLEIRGVVEILGGTTKVEAGGKVHITGDNGEKEHSSGEIKVSGGVLEVLPDGELSREEGAKLTVSNEGKVLGIEEPDMALSSNGIADGVMADAYGAKGSQLAKNIPTRSLPLTVSHIPEGAKSLAVTMIDPDGDNWVHWLAANINFSGSEIEIPENASIDLKDVMVQGKNDFGTTGYGGPTPPSGTHKYVITVYALDTILELKEGFSRKQLESAMEGHVKAQAVLTGDYSRK